MSLHLERISTSFSKPAKELLDDMDAQLRVHVPSNFYVSMNQYNRLHSEALRVSKPHEAEQLFYRGIRVVPI